MAKVNIESIEVAKDEKSVKKILDDSKQLKTNDKWGVKYVEPYYDPDSLIIAYFENSTHQRCINLKSRIISTLLPTDESIKTKLEEIAENSGTIYSELINNFWIDYEIFGYAFLEVVRNRAGDIVKLYNIPAATVRVISDREPGKPAYIQMVGSKVVYFNEFGDEKRDRNLNELIMLKNYNPKNSYYGVPEYSGSITAIGLDHSAKQFNLNLFDRDLLISMAILISGARLSKENKKAIQEFLRGQYQGVENSHKALLIDVPENVDIRIEKLMAEIKDESFSKLRETNRTEVIVAHGVPGVLLGIETPGKLGNTNEIKLQLQAFNQFQIKPRQRVLGYFLKKLFGLKEIVKFEEFKYYTLSELSEFYSKLVQTGVIAPEVASRELGYEEANNGDTLKSIEKLSEKAEKILGAGNE